MRKPDFKPKPDACYRTIPEHEVVDLLLLVSWAAELDAGERATAQAETSAALERWVDAGLGYETGEGEVRLFDPCEVINFMKWAGLHGQDSYWEDHFVKTHRAFVSEFQPARDADGRYPPNRFRMTFRRTVDLGQFAEGASVRLRTPRPLPGAYLSDLEVTPVTPDGVAADLTVRDQCIEARLKSPGGGSLTFGGDFTFTAVGPSGGELSDQERDLYTRKSEGLIRVTERIEALAARLAGEGASTKAAVEAFWTFMIEDLLSGIVRYGDLPADAPGDWVLENGWYDCQLGAALLTSLCRAQGIPARIVSGHCLYRVQPISHYWAEVWFEGEGWRPFDVIGWDLSAGGRDKEWRDLFAGQLDYRGVIQVFPQAFTGPMSVRFPPAWHMVQRAADGGIETTYSSIEDGALIYRDHVAVENLGPA